jgi:twitching motility protein PilT
MALFEPRKAVVPGPAPERSATATPARPAMTPMEDLLRLVVDENASDLHISVGAPPAVRLRGELIKLDLRP